MKNCPNCQKALAADAPDGLCPECLARAGLPSGMELGPDSQTESGRPPFKAPSLEEVARMFPQLEILGLIGQGGMGAVYRARQKELDRLVALKILPPDVGAEPAFADRFAREARALAKLNHPGIVTLYEFGRADGLFFFLMELVDGVNLRQLLSAGRVSAREALAIVPQICDALQYAHDQGVVHRDIKPENIMMDRRGHVKVADFGLAKLVGRTEISDKPAEAEPVSASLLTEAGKVLGTPQYMAPEQKDRPREVDHRADIYSLGVLLYQMLTGELPGKRIEPPSTKVHLDVRLDEVVLRALEKEPGRRYQHVSQIKTDVESIAASGEPNAPLSPDSASEISAPSRPRPSRKRWMPLALAVFMAWLAISLPSGWWGNIPGLAEVPMIGAEARLSPSFRPSGRPSSTLILIIWALIVLVLSRQRRSWTACALPASGTLLLLSIVFCGWHITAPWLTARRTGLTLPPPAKAVSETVPGTNVSAESATAELRFLAWQGEVSEPLLAWHPNGAIVKDTEDQNWIRRIDPGRMRGADPNTRFLYLWFSHPRFDRFSEPSVWLVDTHGSPIMGDETAARIGLTHYAQARHGWVTHVFSPTLAGRVPTVARVVLDYTVGPWQSGISVTPGFAGETNLAEGLVVRGIGQTPDGLAYVQVEELPVAGKALRIATYSHRNGEFPWGMTKRVPIAGKSILLDTYFQGNGAFLRVEQDPITGKGVQHDFIAETRDGQQVERCSVHLEQPEPFRGRFEFKVQLTNVIAFRSRSRSVQTVVFDNVSLLPGQRTKFVKLDPASLPEEVPPTAETQTETNPDRQKTNQR
jgi:serine/threonine protein kinase